MSESKRVLTLDIGATASLDGMRTPRTAVFKRT
jgi:hypothetical protein